MVDMVDMEWWTAVLFETFLLFPGMQTTSISTLF